MSQKIFLSEIELSEFELLVRQIIKEEVQSINSIDQSSDVLTINDLCREFKIAKQTVYRKTSRRASRGEGNKIPYSKVGKNLYFSRRAIKQWMGM
jgi:hypothetical protein